MDPWIKIWIHFLSLQVYSPLIDHFETHTTETKLASLILSLATNNECEQYVCGLCPYSCSHLPSLKRHMWTHVTNRKFDYSLNTAIINTALDYENRLNRFLLAFKLQKGDQKTIDDLLTSSFDFAEYPLPSKINSMIGTNETTTLPSIVSFRCSKCGHSTINLSLLRMHKQQHHTTKFISQTTKTDCNST